MNTGSQINSTTESLCRSLLTGEQSVPRQSLFDDDIFLKTCNKIRSENEQRVVVDIMRLIVPSAENLASYAPELEVLKEKLNKQWIKCIPLLNQRPQPDYSVGFRESAFTDDQLYRLDPFIGKDSDGCSVMSKVHVFFPFLSCEVKCGVHGLLVADRQNLHCAGVSVKGVFELFRRVGQEQTLYGEVLAFSVSHTNEHVRICGFYPLLEGEKVVVYRHIIGDFGIMHLGGEQKWTAYKFTKNLYYKFVPIHLKRLRDAIDKLPAQYNFDVDTSLSCTQG